MSNFLKHIGKHGDRKVAIIFRQVPGDEHMALVVYTELLNQNIHDPLISCIESPQGQASENLGDALNRVYTKDGKIILQVLHMEGMIKKVQSEQIMMTPAPNQRIKLSELNSILDEMAKGEEAVKRLAEIDASRGLQDPKDVAKRMRNQSAVNQPQVQQSASPNGVLGNQDLSVNLRSQAIRMTNEAKGLLAEADRLLKEAGQLEGNTNQVQQQKKTRVKKEPVVQVVETVPTKTSRRKKSAVES